MPRLLQEWLCGACAQYMRKHDGQMRPAVLAALWEQQRQETAAGCDQWWVGRGFPLGQPGQQ